MDRNLGIFLIIIFVLLAAYHFYRRSKNIANVRMGKGRIAALVITGIILLVVNIMYDNTTIGYLLMITALFLIYSMYASEGIAKEGIYTYSRRLFMGKLPFNKISKIEVKETKDGLNLKIDDGLFIFEQVYGLDKREEVIRILRENKLM